MFGLDNAGEKRKILADLIWEIIEQKPPLTHLNLDKFSDEYDYSDYVPNRILGALRNNFISTIRDLNLSNNSSWFRSRTERAWRPDVVIKLLEVIRNQKDCLRVLKLERLRFTSESFE